MWNFQIEGDGTSDNEERETKLFPDKDTDGKIMCHALTTDFLIYGTSVSSMTLPLYRVSPNNLTLGMIITPLNIDGIWNYFMKNTLGIWNCFVGSCSAMSFGKHEFFYGIPLKLGCHFSSFSRNCYFLNSFEAKQKYFRPF